jgi:hypothetical protein
MQTKPNYQLLRSELYIACDQFDFDWTVNAVTKFDEFWKAGNSVQEIAQIMKRDEIEVFMLYLDRVYRNKIDPDMRRVFGS